MKKSKLLVSLAAAIVISSSVYAGITVMADDSAVPAQQQAAPKDEVILSIDELTEDNLTSYNPYGAYNGYGVYSSEDKKTYTIVGNEGNTINTIDNSDDKISRIIFATGCYINNAVYVSNTDGDHTLLNLDGSYYGGLKGYFNDVSMELGNSENNTGDYFVESDTNFIFYKKDGTELFRMDTNKEKSYIQWKVVGGYNVLTGLVGNTSFKGVYDNNLNKVYDTAYLADDGRYFFDNGTNTIFFSKDGKELFRIPFTGIVGTWVDFNGYNILKLYDKATGTKLFYGLYDNSLKSVIETPANCGYFGISNNLLQYTVPGATKSESYYYDSSLKICEAPKSEVSKYTLEDSYYVSRSFKVDGITYILGSKNVTEGGKTFQRKAIFDTTGKMVFSKNVFNVFQNGLCEIKDLTTGKFQLVKLSIKTLENASKSQITANADNIKKADITLPDSASGSSLPAEPVKIHIEANASVIPEGASICVGKLKSGDGARFELARSAVKDTSAQFSVFDIDLLTSNNVKVQPDGTVKVSLTVPSTFSTNALKVYRIETDGTKTDMNATIVGNTVVFETSHFSIYVLSDEFSSVNAPVISADTNVAADTNVVADTNIVSDVITSTSPTTADNSAAVYYFVLVILASVSATAMLFLKKKKIIEE